MSIGNEDIKIDHKLFFQRLITAATRGNGLAHIMSNELSSYFTTSYDSNIMMKVVNSPSLGMGSNGHHKIESNIVVVGSPTVIVLLTSLHCHDYIIITSLVLVMFFNKSLFNLVLLSLFANFNIFWMEVLSFTTFHGRNEIAGMRSSFLSQCIQKVYGRAILCLMATQIYPLHRTVHTAQPQ